MDEIEFPEALRDSLRESWHRYLDLLNPVRPALFAYCRRLTGSVWDAEDLVQESLVRAFGTLGKTHYRVRNPRAYLLRVATNTWIDTLRRKETAEAGVSDVPVPEADDPAGVTEVRDAGARLLQRLSPQERAAVVLKDVFDLSLEETAEVLETTIGAIKAALHRARERLREPEGAAASRRPRPSVAVVDRFVELFNARDRSGLLALMLDTGTVDMVGVAYGFGRESMESEDSWFNGALGGHPEWPEAFRFDSQRVERADYEGEPIVLLFRTRRGREHLEQVMRLQEQAGRVARIRDYAFCPETVKEVGEALGHRVLTGLYRYPSPEPGVGYGEADLRAKRDGMA